MEVNHGLIDDNVRLIRVVVQNVHYFICKRTIIKQRRHADLGNEIRLRNSVASCIPNGARGFSAS